jgi:hypothetical protein
MGARKRIALILGLGLLALLALVGIVLGQGEPVDLGLDLAGGGGGESGAGRYGLTDSVGQPAASDTPSRDGERYEWRDGFWYTREGVGQTTIYLPLVVKDVR